jgi:hypothetical protein
MWECFELYSTADLIWNIDKDTNKTFSLTFIFLKFTIPVIFVLL